MLLFASLREVAGASEFTLELRDGAVVGDALDALCSRNATLAPWIPRVRYALEQEFVGRAVPLFDGAELALIPPVAGGDHSAWLSDEPLSVDACISSVKRPQAGAIVVFIGVVRDHSRGETIVRLEYESYREMAAKQLALMIDRIVAQEPEVRLAVSHRVGALAVGDLAVVLAASAPHRAEAFAAARELIEALKRDAPIWKKEFSDAGVTWVGLGP